jgi:hypothetical protein
MAEKSGELENQFETDAIATTGVTNSDTSLQTRSEDDFAMAISPDDDVTATNDDATADTEQLREQIEETRRGMGETIDAIQEKLSIANISEQVKDQVSEQFGSAVESVRVATVEKASDFMKVINQGIKEIQKSDIARTAAQNPWILSVVGLGVGALVVNSLFSGSKNNSSRRNKNKRKFKYDESENRYREDYGRRLKSSSQSDSKEESTVRTAGKKVGSTASSAYEGVTSAAGTVYESVGGAASTVYEGVGSAASSAYSGVSKATGKTYETVGNADGFVYDKAGDLGGQVKVNYEHYIKENPIAVGAVALAVGAVVGMAIPLTKAENQYMGEYRDNVLEKAQTAAQDAIGSVKQMATEAQNVIAEEIKSQTAT